MSLFLRTIRPRWLVVVGAAWLAHGAQAQCSRAIQAPVAPIGLGVVTDTTGVGGIYPALMREFGQKHGCRFDFDAVPRARQEMLIENGQGDVLVPASRSPRRDAWGHFVPLLQARPAAMSLQGRQLFVADLQQVLARRELRLAVVRGFDFGDGYRSALAQLRQSGRLVEEVDASAVARALHAGMADLTVMTPTILWGALQSDERLRPLIDQFRVDVLSDMDWNDTGVYLSRRSLTATDQRQLTRLFDDAARSGRVWALTQAAYGNLPLDGWMRPISAAVPSRPAPSTP